MAKKHNEKSERNSKSFTGKEKYPYLSCIVYFALSITRNKNIEIVPMQRAYKSDLKNLLKNLSSLL